MIPRNEDKRDAAHVEYCPYCMTQAEPDKPCPNCGLTAGSYQPQSKHLPAGAVLKGRYLLGRVLGEGGFGITYIGRDLVLGLKVAIKEYFPTDRATRNCAVSTSVESFLGDQNAIFERGKQRFLEEARTMARLDRLPNIVGVRDFFEENATAYIVMEYIDGTTLSSLVKQRGGVLPAWELLHLIEPLFDSLSAMHEIGLIHRDISPDNLMLEHGIIKLLDFGCAREAADGDATMTIMLRHGYAPLEQYQSSSGAQGPWTDVYALAATIYFCITGQKPPQSMDRIFVDDLVPPRKLGADLSAGQELALLKALKVAPKARFQSVKEFHTALYLGVVTVRFDAGGGNVTEVSVTKGDKLKPGDIPAPQREGLRFTGWFLDEDCKKPARDAEVTDECTLYAGWEEQKPPKGPSEKTDPAKPPFWKNRIFRIAAAAAVGIAVLGGALALALGGRDKPDAEGPGDTGPVYSGPGAEDTTAPTDVPAGPAQDVPVSTLAQLKMRLKDDNVASIQYTGKVFQVDDPLEITKPVTVLSEEVHINARLDITSTLRFESWVEANGVINVTGEEARLELMDGFGGGNAVRTRDGGRIRCLNPDINYSFETLWLANNSDLETGGAQTESTGPHFILDADAIFAGAVHVSSMEELSNAVSNPLVTAIVLDGDLDTAEFGVSKPLMIAEGVTVSGGGYMNITGTLVNRGTLKGGAVEVNGGRLINEGICSVTSLGISGNDKETRLINTGTMTVPWGNISDTLLINLGELRVESETPGNELYVGGSVYNYGSFLQSTTGLHILPGGSFYNAVYTRLDGDVENSGTFAAGGQRFIVAGNLYGDGLFETGINCATTPDGVIGAGILLGEPNVVNDLNLNECRVIYRRWAADEIADISAAGDFLASAAAGGVRLMSGADVRVDGDLELTHDLVMEAGSSLTVTGTLTVTNGAVFELRGAALEAHSVVLAGGANLVCDVPGAGLKLSPEGELAITDGADAVLYQAVDINGASVRLENGGLYNNGALHGCGDITLRGDAAMYDMDIDWTGTLTVGDGAFFYGIVEDFPAQVVVEDGGLMVLSGYSTLRDGCSITVRGTLWFRIASLVMEQGVKIANENELHVNSRYDASAFLGGEIENRGRMYFCGTVELSEGGVIDNRNYWEYEWGGFTSRGQVNNRGSFILDRHQDANSSAYLANLGVWTGKDPTYKNAD